MNGKSALARLGRRALGILLGAVVWAWVRTLRVSVTGAGTARFLDAARSARPVVIGFLHGQQFALHAVRRVRPAAVLVSLSTDGDVQAAALGVLSLRVVRGSSSRGGARGLAALTRALRGGTDAAFAVDGPRGPPGVPKPGAALAAIRAGAALLPVATAVSRGILVARAWDRFEIPLPFARVAVVVDAPIGAGGVSSMTAELGLVLTRARADAERALRGEAREVPGARTIAGAQNVSLVVERHPWQSE